MNVSGIFPALTTPFRDDGSVARVSDRLASFELRQQAVNKAEWDRLDEKYRQDG